MSTTTSNRRHVQDDRIPKDLHGLKQWVVWKYAMRKGKETKIPYNARSGREARTDDPDTWSNLSVALAKYRDGYDGIGFVFAADDPYVGIDLDNCLTDGVLNPWASDIVERLDTYAEISPSGNGLKLLCRGTIPVAPDKTGRKKKQIEMYCRRRFFTVTGNQWPGTPDTIRDCSEELTDAPFERVDNWLKELHENYPEID